MKRTSAVQKLTQSALRGMPLNHVLWDTEVKGFAVRCNQDGSKTYFTRYYIDGRQRQLVIGPASVIPLDKARAEATRIINGGREGIDEQKRRDFEKVSTLTVAEAVPMYLANYGPHLKAQTLASYERNLRKHVVPALGTRYLQTLEPTDIRKLHIRLHDTPRLANLTVRTFSSLFSWALDYGILPHTTTNPCKGVQYFPENEREQILTPEEHKRLGDVLANALKNPDEHRLIVAIWVIIYTGARIGEIKNLRAKDIDEARKILTLVDSKTGPRKIMIAPEEIELLRTLKAHGPEGYLYPESIRKETSRTVNRVWERLRKEAGLPKLRLHDLRHNFGSIAMESGASLIEVAKQLGHSTPRMTARYTHASDRGWRTSHGLAANALQGLIGRPELPKEPDPAPSGQEGQKISRRTGDE